MDDSVSHNSAQLNEMMPADYDADTPVVSIVILNLDKPEMTIDCLEAIWKRTNGIPYEVIVVDNGSTAGNKAILESYEGPQRVLSLAINRFFGEGNNIGAEAAKGEYVLFLNNDVIVQKGWLPPLVEVLKTQPDAGCSGPKFIYPDGYLQEAGGLLDEDGSAVQIGKFQSPDQPRFNRMRTVDYVSAACVLMRRKDFIDVLGFDFRYEPAYYEDCDLCLKIGALGKKTYYVPASEVEHYESTTTSDKAHELRLNTIVGLNRQKFVTRWQDFLKTGRHDTLATPSSLVPETSRNKKTAGIYTPYNIIPGGGERYLLSVMRVFETLGYSLTLVVPEVYSRIRISAVLEKLELTLDAIEIITHQEAEQSRRFDLFFSLGNEICPPCKTLGDISLYCCQFPLPSAQQELDRRLPWLTDYDAVICYSEFVAEEIGKKIVEFDLQDQHLQVVSPPVGMKIDVPKSSPKSGILAIGRFFSGGHCKRQDMMVSAMKGLKDRGVQSRLNLVGSLHPEPEHREYFTKCQTDAKDLPVTFHVDAASDTLGDLLYKSSLYWHGAGLGVNVDKDPGNCEPFGISVVEAMAARVIPFVVNNGGPSLIVEDGISGFHYSSEEELVALTEKVLALPDDEIETLRDNAAKRAAQFSDEAFRTNLIALHDMIAQQKTEQLAQSL
jgi:GT2 family glycosyltransferase/glycosyltransferase involved in cell wall biosynthesis